MSERIRAVQNRRRSRTNSRLKGATTREQVSNQRLSARNQLVGQNVPWPRLDLAALRKSRKLRGTTRGNIEVVFDDDRLAIEQKTLGKVRRIVEQLVDERNEPLTKSLERMIPLAIPVCV